MEKTPKGSNNAENVLNWVEKLSGMIKNSGLQNIIITLMVLFLVIVIGKVAFDPESFMTKIDGLRAKAHTEAIMKRMDAEPKIREAIVNLKYELNADRVYILETHNGGNNLANLPFIYVDLTYAEPKASLSWLENEYKNVRLSRYPWATQLYNDAYWSGNIEEISNIDQELYLRLKVEEVAYMADIVLYGTYNPSGVLGVVYTDLENKPSDEIIRRALIKYSSSLALLLNNE